MNRLAKYTVTSFWLLICGPVFAVSYPNEAQMRAAITEAAQLLKAEDLMVEIRDAQKEGQVGPRRPLMAAGLNLLTNTCRVYYNTQPENGLAQFFEKIHETDISALLIAIAVHEVTHCVEQREAYVRKRFDKVLPNDLKRGSMTVQGYLTVVKSGAVDTWREALADIASILYLKQTVPDKWVMLAESIAAMRHNLAEKWPKHDTSAWLYKLIAADPAIPENQSVFEKAFQMRSQLRCQLREE